MLSLTVLPFCTLSSGRTELESLNLTLNLGSAELLAFPLALVDDWICRSLLHGYIAADTPELRSCDASLRFRIRNASVGVDEAGRTSFPDLDLAVLVRSLKQYSTA